MSACPLFSPISQVDKTVKLKGVNIDTCTNFNRHYSCVGIVRLEFAEIKGAIIILHAKSPTFRAAKSEGFTVLATVLRPRVSPTMSVTSCY